MRHRQRKMRMLYPKKKLKRLKKLWIYQSWRSEELKDNIDALTGTGIDGVAVVSAIFGAKDITKDTKELLKTVKKMKHE